MISHLKSQISSFVGAVRNTLWDASRRPTNLKSWGMPAPSPNRHFDNPVILRAEAESQFRNNAIVRGAVNKLSDAVLGATGLNPKFEDQNTQQVWENWAGYHWVPFLQLVFQTMVVSGEAFVLLAIDETQAVPLRCDVLGPEFLDTSRSDDHTFAGIRYQRSRPVGYWLFKRNPAFANISNQSVYVPAEQCLHIFKPISPGAERGQTELAPIMRPARELDELCLAGVVKEKTLSLLTAFVLTPDSDEVIKADGSDLIPNAGLEPGSAVTLKPGQDVKAVEPAGNSNIADLTRIELQRIATSLGLPYSSLSGDYSQTTFASGRAALLEFRRHCEALQYGVLVPQLCEPIRRRWCEIAHALGLIQGDIKNVRWIGPTIEMLDQNAETRAVVAKIRAGLMSRSEAVAQTGWRAEDIDAELAADNARADQLGLVLDSDPRKVTAQGQAQQEAVNV